MKKSTIWIYCFVVQFTYSAVGQSQTIVSIGHASGASEDLRYHIGISVSNTDPIAGMQFDLTDAQASLRLDTVLTCDRITGFRAMNHNNRILLYHPEGVSFPEGAGPVLELVCSLDHAIAGVDSIYFRTQPVVASAAGDGLLSVFVHNGYIASDSMVSTDHPLDKKPVKYALYPIYPNPFNNTTTIAFDLESAGLVLIRLFDVRGHLVQTVCNALKTTGKYNIVWYANEFPTGIYFCQLKVNGYCSMRKMLLLR